MTSVALHHPITIGVDPHPKTHTASALDPTGRILGQITSSSDEQGVNKLLAWAQHFPNRQWAVEGAGNNYTAALIKKLQIHEEQVFNITPSVTAQYRQLRGRKKTDQIDAANAARALLANPQLQRYERSVEQRKLQQLTRAYRRVAKQLKAQRMTLKECDDPEVQEALGLLVVALENCKKQLRKAIARVVQKYCPELLEVLGVGVIVAGVIVAEVGCAARFKNRDQFCAFGGLAPIQRVSGQSGGVRVNSGGNRRLNWAVHILVRSRLRVDERSKAYVERKVGEGKTRRAAMRCLKTFAAREIYRVLRRSRVMKASVGP